MLKKMNIGKKLIIAFIIVAILASIAGVVSTALMKKLDADYSYALSYYGFPQGDIGKAITALTDSRRAVGDIVGLYDQADINSAITQLSELQTETNTQLAAIERTVVGEDEQRTYNNAVDAIGRYRIKRDEVVALGNTLDQAQSRLAQQMMVDELDPLYKEAKQYLTTLMDANVNTGNALSNQLTALGQFSLFLSIGLIVGAMVLSIVLGVIISRSIANPVKQCAARLELLSQGDLDSPIPEITSQDETGVLADATSTLVHGFNAIIGDVGFLLGEMAKGNFSIRSKAEQQYVGGFQPILVALRDIRGSLSDTLSKIGVASDQVASGSDQVSSGAQALSQGATEQASSVEELAATIAEISQQIKQNAQDAQEASSKANRAGAEVETSNRQMQEMIAAMAEISSTSGEIGKIIKTIDDIAFQTNILALNAAVEAARAGAAGKGFAVVADEVRNLASKSAEAAKNTTDLIESSLQAVGNGTHIADETAKSLLSVVAEVKDVVSTVDRISAASSEQATSIAQVTQGVDQISSVVQTNSATSQQSAAASEELSGQAQMLKDLVGRFQLEGDTRPASHSLPAEPAGTFVPAGSFGGKY